MTVHCVQRVCRAHLASGANVCQPQVPSQQNGHAWRVLTAARRRASAAASPSSRNTGTGSGSRSRSAPPGFHRHAPGAYGASSASGNAAAGELRRGGAAPGATSTPATRARSRLSDRSRGSSTSSCASSTSSTRGPASTTSHSGCVPAQFVVWRRRCWAFSHLPGGREQCQAAR